MASDQAADLPRPGTDEKGSSAEPPVAQAKPGAHIPALDAVRGLAIVIVTLSRFGGVAVEAAADLPPWLAEVVKLGERGVDLFFVLSGFLITGILYDAKNTPYYFRNFYMRRTLRIFPLYYGVLFVAFVVIPLTPWGNSLFPEIRHYQAWLWLYGANILTAKHGTWEVLGSFNHFWSLAVEEHFYLFWPLIIFFLSRRSAMWACVLFSLAAVALRVAIAVTTRNDPAVEGLTPCRMDALAIGGLLALAARGPNGMRDLIGLSRVVLIVCGLLWAVILVAQNNLLSLPYTLYALFFGAMIVLAVVANPASVFGRFWNSATLRFFGKYSYGMYVFQNPLIPTCFPLISAAALAEQLGSSVAGGLLYVAVMSSITVAVALLSWHLYEKHFLKLKVYFEAKPTPRNEGKVTSGAPSAASRS